MWLALFLLKLQSKHYIPDSAIECLLKFLHAFFIVIGRFSEPAKGIAEYLPKTIYSLKRYVGVINYFDKFVNCPKCNAIYTALSDQV